MRDVLVRRRGTIRPVRQESGVSVRRVTAALAAVLGAAVLSSSTPAHADTALLIGVSEYPTLGPGASFPSARNNLRQMEQALHDARFTIVKVEGNDTSAEGVLARLDDLAKRETSRLLVYISARGTNQNGVPAVLLSDRPEPLARFVVMVGQAHAARKALLVDASFSAGRAGPPTAIGKGIETASYENEFWGSGNETARSAEGPVPKGGALLANTAVLLAAEPGQPAFATKGGLGQFTSWLTGAIRSIGRAVIGPAGQVVTSLVNLLGGRRSQPTGNSGAPTSSDTAARLDELRQLAELITGRQIQVPPTLGPQVTLASLLSVDNPSNGFRISADPAAPRAGSAFAVNVDAPAAGWLFIVDTDSTGGVGQITLDGADPASTVEGLLTQARVAQARRVTMPNLTANAVGGKDTQDTLKAVLFTDETEARQFADAWNRARPRTWSDLVGATLGGTAKVATRGGAGAARFQNFANATTSYSVSP